MRQEWRALAERYEGAVDKECRIRKEECMGQVPGPVMVLRGEGAKGEGLEIHSTGGGVGEIPQKEGQNSGLNK